MKNLTNHAMPMCPKCRRHALRIKKLPRTEDAFYVCDNYPYCSFVSPLLDGDGSTDRGYDWTP